MLPDLGRLALLHAHEEEEPTGVLAEWKRRREAVRPQLVEGLPLELRQLVTDQLVAKNAGDGVALCKELEAWCRAHPVACTKPGLWEAAFEAAFGTLKLDQPFPGRFDKLLLLQKWLLVDDDDLRLSTSLEAWLRGLFITLEVPMPLPYKDMFRETCNALGSLDPSEARVYARMASWTDAQRDYYGDQPFEDRDNKQKPYSGTLYGSTPQQWRIWALLKLLGADRDRYRNQIELARAVRGGTVDQVRRLLESGLDPDYVLPHLRGFPGLPGSLLYRVVRQNSHLNPDGVAVVRLLLEHGADPNGVDVHGHRMTNGALHWAIRHAPTVWPEGLEQVKLLLAAGADPTLRGATEKRPNGMTPRELLVEMRHRPGPRSDRANALLLVLDEAIAAREAAAIAAA